MSLYDNINRRKKLGISRPKSAGSVSDESYADMKAGFPNSKKNKRKRYMEAINK
jgi:hypothetical protein